MTIQQLKKKFNDLKESYAQSVVAVALIDQKGDKWHARVECVPDIVFNSKSFDIPCEPEYIEFDSASCADAEKTIYSLAGKYTPCGRRMIIDNRLAIIIDDI